MIYKIKEDSKPKQFIPFTIELKIESPSELCNLLTRLVMLTENMDYEYLTEYYNYQPNDSDFILLITALDQIAVSYNLKRKT